MLSENESLSPVESFTHTIDSKFRISFFILIGAVVVGVIVQHVFYWSYQWSDSILVHYGIPTSIIVIFSYLLYIKSRNILTTPFFAISSLLSIAVATALGTLISQNLPDVAFTDLYGASLANFLQFFFLNDLFHSWWYAGLFIALSASLLLIDLKHPFIRKYIGFHLAHLSPIIIITGFWVDFYYGFRGIIQLEKGESSAHVARYFRNTSFVLDTVTLDFKLRLDSFESEKHNPDYKIQIWKRNATWQTQTNSEGEQIKKRVPEIVAAVPLAKDQPEYIFGTDISFKLIELFPNFYFKYTHPRWEPSDSAPDPGIVMDVKTFAGEQTVQLMGYDEAHNRIEDPHVNAYVMFYWELPQDVMAMLNSSHPEGKWASYPWIIISGKDRLIHRINKGTINEESLEIDTFYPFSYANPKDGFTPTLLFTDASQVGAEPATKNDEMINPVAWVTVNRESSTSPQDAYIFPTKGSNSGFFFIPDSEYFLALESMKDRETKYWKSSVSFLNNRNELIKEGSIQVNEPVKFKGYRFYQTDYNPDNPDYSGIGVSREPGLYIVYFGFYMLVAGVFTMFYLRSKNDINV